MVENGQFYASLTIQCIPNTLVGLPTNMAVVDSLDLGMTSGAGALYVFQTTYVMICSQYSDAKVIDIQ